MKKKEAVESSLEEMDARYQKEQIEKHKEEVSKRQDIARPSLLKRIGAALLDFIFAAVFAGGVFVFSYFVIFPSLGYQKASKDILDCYSSSELFVQEGGNFEEITKHYDSDKSVEQNYDVPITHYYSTDTRAIADNKLDGYNTRKIESGLYELNGEGQFVRKEGVTSSQALTFLQEEYDKAVDYFYLNPELISNTRLTYYTMAFSILIIVSITSAIFYFLIPLLTPRRQTLGYLIARLIPVTGEDMLRPTRGKIALRAFIFVIITFISPLTISFLFTNGIMFAFIPFFANTMILSFSRSNSGLHDYASRIYVINLSHSNPFETLKAVTGQGEE